MVTPHNARLAVASRPLGRDAAGRLFFENLNGVATSVEPAIAAALERCAAWRTLAEHAGMLGPTGALLLSRLAQAGFLVSEDEAGATLASRTRFKRSASVKFFALVSGDRPRDARAALSAFFSAPAPRPPLLLVDDSRTEAAAYRELVEEARTAGPVTHLDRSARAQMAAAVAQELGVPSGLFERLLLGEQSAVNRVGAARNCVLALGAGCRFAMFDDDIHGAVVPCDSEEVVVPTDDPEIRPAPMHAAGEYVPMSTCTLLPPLVSLLRPIDALPVALSPKLGRYGQALHAALRGTRSPRVASAGLVGDCGMDSPFVWLASALRDAERRPGYEESRLSRRVHLVVPTSTLALVPMWMSFASAFHHSGWFPMFPGGGRGSDGLFADLLFAGEPDTAIAHSRAFAVHTPSEPRSFSVADLELPLSGAEANAALSLTVRAITARSRIGQNARSRLAKALADLARARDVTTVRDAIADAIAARQGLLSAGLADGALPASMRADAEHCLRIAARALQSRDGLFPPREGYRDTPDRSVAIERFFSRMADVAEGITMSEAIATSRAIGACRTRILASAST